MVSHSYFLISTRHLSSNVKVVEGEIDDWLNEQGMAGEQADLIFMDLDKTCYEPIYSIVKEHNLLKPGGLLLCDNVLYRGLTAQGRYSALSRIDVSSVKFHNRCLCCYMAQFKI